MPMPVVYIPTRGRVGLAYQLTLREFLTKSSVMPILVCPPDEVSLHWSYYRRVYGCPHSGIGPTRQWILDRATYDVLVMADDDMTFAYRPDPAVSKLEVCQDLNPLLEYVYLCATRLGFIHGGVGARQGNQNIDLSGPRGGTIDEQGRLTIDCTRVNNFHFVNRPAVLRTGARFDVLPVMEDFHFTLWLLTRGIPNRVIHDYVWNQRGSGRVGGCSLYRTPQVQTQGAEGLARAFPKYVRVVTKTGRATSGLWSGSRTDVKVYWSRAYGDATVRPPATPQPRTTHAATDTPRHAAGQPQRGGAASPAVRGPDRVG
jgi:hypothetical protein